MSSDDDQFLGTVLVTGGAGIVGSFVCEELVKHLACRKVVATYHSKKKHQHSCPGVEYHVCDITNSKEVKQLLDEAQPNLIIHTVSPQVFAAPELQHKVNYIATKDLVEQAKAHPAVKALIFTSSIYAVVLNSNLANKPQSEDETTMNTLDSKAAISAYGRTKGAADALVLAANSGTPNDKASDYSGQLLTTTLRVAGLYGERDLKTIWELVKVVNTPATRFQIGPDKVMHEWVYTANVAHAHILAAEALLDGKHSTPETKVDGESFFITDGSPMKFWEFSRKVWIAAGDRYLTALENPRIIEMPFWMVGLGVSVTESVRKLWNASRQESKLSGHHLAIIEAGCSVSIEKARTRLGYKPMYDTEEGIKRSVAWFLNKENEVWLKT